MVSIDKLAYTSDLRKVNAMEKVIFSIATMFSCSLLNNIIDSILVFLLMSFIIILRGKVKPKIYGKLLLLPIIFLIIGTATIAINVSNKFESSIFSFTLFYIRFACTKGSIYASLKIFFKSLSAVSCLYFLSLTTPVFEILSVLRKFKVPKLFVELMGLIYRFIFVLLDTSRMIFVSQNSRLGYANLKYSFKSIGMLIASLFISSYKRAQDIYTAMESRCYDGEINILENKYKVSYVNIILIFSFQILLLFINIGRNVFWGGY